MIVASPAQPGCWLCARTTTEHVRLTNTGVFWWEPYFAAYAWPHWGCVHGACSPLKWSLVNPGGLPGLRGSLATYAYVKFYGWSNQLERPPPNRVRGGLHFGPFNGHLSNGLRLRRVHGLVRPNIQFGRTQGGILGVQH